MYWSYLLGERMRQIQQEQVIRQIKRQAEMIDVKHVYKQNVQNKNKQLERGKRSKDEYTKHAW